MAGILLFFYPSFSFTLFLLFPSECKERRQHRHRGKSQRITGMEQPLHQPRNSKGQKYGKRQGRIIVPGLLPVLKPACLPECQCIPEHLYQAHDSQQQINSAGYKAMVMDHLKIGIMGMDAERTVRSSTPISSWPVRFQWDI